MKEENPPAFLCLLLFSSSPLAVQAEFGSSRSSSLSNLQPFQLYRVLWWMGLLPRERKPVKEGEVHNVMLAEKIHNERPRSGRRGDWGDAVTHIDIFGQQFVRCLVLLDHVVIDA